MTTKTYAHNIEHQSNIRMIIWDHDKLTKCKLNVKWIIKFNSKSTKY
jgi:hypothetical protein